MAVDLRNVIGLGVAGNFAGHLEQAGEASDFKDLVIEDANAPKGVFPFYVPLASSPGTRDAGDQAHFLHTFPVSDRLIRLGSPEEKHQIEPEVSLLCELHYDKESVKSVKPIQATAHNDCSIRREGAKKISEKKNWGADTKGTASQSIPIDRFEKGGVLDHCRIASYLVRDGQLHAYGVDSAASSYSYMYGQLLDWLVVKLNDQIDEGPLEQISEWLRIAGRPSHALISIGATRYTDFGETNFLEPGDRSIVAVYDTRHLDLATTERIAMGDEAPPAQGLSLLVQEIV